MQPSSPTERATIRASFGRDLSAPRSDATCPRLVRARSGRVLLRGSGVAPRGRSLRDGADAVTSSLRIRLASSAQTPRSGS